MNKIEIALDDLSCLGDRFLQMMLDEPSIFGIYPETEEGAKLYNIIEETLEGNKSESAS